MTARAPLRRQLLVGDARRRLAELPAASVDMVLTSPPYFRLRDYGSEQQIGLEPAVAEWVVALRGIGSRWDEVVLPVDFVVVENTLGKFGTRVEELNRVPRRVQPLVGRGIDAG